MVLSAILHLGNIGFRKVTIVVSVGIVINILLVLIL